MSLQNKRGGGKMIVVSLVGLRKKLGRVLRLLTVLIILILLISVALKLINGNFSFSSEQRTDGTLIKLNYLLDDNFQAPQG